MLHAILTPEELATQSSCKTCSHVRLPIHRRAYHVTVFDNERNFGIAITLDKRHREATYDYSFAGDVPFGFCHSSSQNPSSPGVTERYIPV